MRKDPTKGDIKVVNAFIEPILKEAIAKRGTPQDFAARKVVEEGETLLDHLITYTKGKFLSFTGNSSC